MELAHGVVYDIYQDLHSTASMHSFSHSEPAMNPDAEIAFQYPPFIVVYKSGRCERPISVTAGAVPASVDHATGIASRDVVIEPKNGVAARLYLPNLSGRDPGEKLPVLVYYHGGGFCFGSAFSGFCHNYLNSIVAKSRVLAVSVEYRIAPEHPLPAAHDDSWAALEWVASHAEGGGADEWLTKHADFNRVFVAGDSAGGNLAYHMAMRAAEHGVGINGMALLCPYFWGTQKFPSEMEVGRRLSPETIDTQWPYLCPGTSGDDPLINPLADGPRLARLGCKRALIYVGGTDVLRDRAKAYYQELKTNGWGGDAELLEIPDEDHCFHVAKPESDKAKALMQHLATFFNQE